MSDLLATLEAERAMAEADRPTRATDAALDRAIAVVRAGAVTEHEAERIRRVVTDSWRWQAPVSEELLTWLERAPG